MRFTSIVAPLLGIWTSQTQLVVGQLYAPAKITPPPIQREFRGIWVTTINNLCWPSKPGLPTEIQKKELVEILDKAAEAGFNAILLQVRTACDALYSSRFDPWSEVLSGTCGKPPEPFYDPLEFAITEAHKRGLELYAWLNPFRAWHPSFRSRPPQNHISNTKPELIRKYGQYLWLDPGEPDTKLYTLAVISDILRRYNVDGIVFDDYFYPYPEKGQQAEKLEFPDEDTYRKYGAGVPKVEWRRKNIDSFVKNVSQLIINTKPWVKFGISPFGIWRPNNPKGVRGLDAYNELGADSRGWLQKGWVDFLAPQLYWRTDSREQNFSTLAKWWAAQKKHHCNLFISLLANKSLDDWSVEELLAQIQITRSTPGINGHILFDARILTSSNQTIAKALKNKVYVKCALPPQIHWRARSARLPTPTVYLDTTNKVIKVALPKNLNSPPAWWILYTQTGLEKRWSIKIYPATVTALPLTYPFPEIVAVSLVDKYGATSAPVGFKLIK